MNERDRLIELTHNHNNPALKWFPNNYEILQAVEYLLANGVIVPPCKIGDTAYCIVYAKDGYKNIIEHRIVGFHIIDAPPKRGFKRENYLIFFHEQTNLTSHCPFKKIGKNVFFTREEAEQALAERNNQS